MITRLLKKFLLIISSFCQTGLVRPLAPVLFEWIRGADEQLSREVQSLLR